MDEFLFSVHSHHISIRFLYLFKVDKHKVIPHCFTFRYLINHESIFTFIILLCLFLLITCANYTYFYIGIFICFLLTYEEVCFRGSKSVYLMFSKCLLIGMLFIFNRSYSGIFVIKLLPFVVKHIHPYL